MPSWVPDTPDGDDSDNTKGKMILDNSGITGDLISLDPVFLGTINIWGNVVYSSYHIGCDNYYVESGASLTVKNIFNLFGSAKVTVMSGGHLIIDGGIITNSGITLQSGGQLTIKNGGKIVMKTGSDFTAPTGAVVNILNGEITRSNDF